MAVTVNGRRYEGRHKSRLICAILMTSLGFGLLALPINLLVQGLVQEITALWIIGAIALAATLCIGITGSILLCYVCGKIRREMNEVISNTPVVSGYHPQVTGAQPASYPTAGYTSQQFTQPDQQQFGSNTQHPYGQQQLHQEPYPGAWQSAPPSYLSVPPPYTVAVENSATDYQTKY